MFLIGLLEKETAEKIQIVDADELDVMQDLIAAEQLEQKFGGSRPNLTQYWYTVIKFFYIYTAH